MRRPPLPNALDIDLRGGLTDAVTPHAGVTLLIETIRRSGVVAAADRHLPAKRSPRGLGQGAMVEALVLLFPSAATASTTSNNCAGTWGTEVIHGRKLTCVRGR